MNGPLTLRLEERGATISRDDGVTALLPSETAEDIARRLEGMVSVLDWSHEHPTASLLGSLGEAQQSIPRAPSHRPPSEELWKGEAVPIGRLATGPSRPFKEVLQARRSWRSLGGLSLRDLASVLVQSARVRAWMETADGYQITHRPAPSVGARHPSELVVAVKAVDGLSPGWWWFDATRCVLIHGGVGLPPAVEALAGIMEAGHLSDLPGAAIFLLTHFDRTLSRYPNGGALIWRDVGVLLGLLHLCATDQGLGSCIIGSCGLLGIRRKSGLVTDTGALAMGAQLF